jgi:hypothetical protein
MSRWTGQAGKASGAPPAAVGLGVLAVLCCAGVPLMVGLVGGLTLADVAEAGAAGLAGAVFVAAGVLLVRPGRRGAGGPIGRRATIGPLGAIARMIVGLSFLLLALYWELGWRDVALAEAGR